MNSIITDEKIVQKIVKIIFDINQLFKNVYNNKEYYFFIKGKVYSIDRNQLPQYLIADIEPNKIKEINDFFKNSIFKINGKEFFDFINSNKKDKVNKIILKDNSITFVKSIDELKFDFDLDEVKLTINQFKSFKKNFQETYLEEVKLNNKYIDKILDQPNSVQRFILDVDKNEVVIDNNRLNDSKREIYTEISLSKKFIIGLKVNKNTKEPTYTKTYFSLYGNNDLDNIFFIEIKICNSLITLKQYYIVTDVVIDEE